MGPKCSQGAIVTALLLSVALGADAQTPVRSTPQPIVLDVTWELSASGYECQARIVLQASYEVRPWKEFTGGGEWGEALPDDVCGDAAHARCFVLKYCEGRLVSSSGKNSAGDTTIFTEAAATEGHPYGPEGLIRPARDGATEIVFYRQPGFKTGNAAAEEALGCWNQDWPAMKLKDFNLRELQTLRHHWENPAADPEMIATSPGCKPGQASVVIHAVSSQTCELLETACEQARSWLACVHQQLSDLERSVVQARVEAIAESAGDQSLGVPEARGYPQLLLALDRLQQAIPDLQLRLGATEVAIAADCGLLPGPENQEKCQKVAKQVEDQLDRDRVVVKLGLEAQTAIFESSTAPAVSFMARAKLLGQLRATGALVGTCYIRYPARRCLPR